MGLARQPAADVAARRSSGARSATGRTLATAGSRSRRDGRAGSSGGAGPGPSRSRERAGGVTGAPGRASVHIRPLVATDHSPPAGGAAGGQCLPGADGAARPGGWGRVGPPAGAAVSSRARPAMVARRLSGRAVAGRAAGLLRLSHGRAAGAGVGRDAGITRRAIAGAVRVAERDAGLDSRATPAGI